MANIGLPFVVLGLPFVVIMLIPVVVIEALLFRRNTGTPVKEGMKPIAWANVASTLLGYPFAWLLQFLIQLGLMTLIPMLVSDTSSPIFSNPIVQSLGFIFGAAWLVPLESSFWWMIPAAGMVGLIPAFFVSVWVETKVANRFFKDRIPNLRKAIFQSNVGSYIFLLIVLLGVLVNNFSALDPKLRALALEGARVGSRHGEYWVSTSRDSHLDKVVDEMLKLDTVVNVNFQFNQSDPGPISKLGRLKKLKELDLSGTKVTDEQLKTLGSLDSLEKLKLRNTQITGSGFASFSILDTLKDLDLSETKISDSELEFLAKFSKVKRLNLSNTKISGTGFKHLEGLNQIENLDLTGIPISEAGAKELKNLKSVQSINLAETPITNDGLAGLTGFEDLRTLHLWKTKISDSGLKHIQGITTLQNLSINLPGITDEGLAYLTKLNDLEVIDLNDSGVIGPGLKHLYGLKKLKRVWLKGTKVSADDATSLRTAVPGAEVFTN